MKIKLLLLLMMLLMLQACSPLSSSQRGETLTPLAPTLEPAINFEEGLSQVPAGYYLFLEFYGRSTYSPECNMAPGPPAPPNYNFASGELMTSQPNITTALSSPIVGLFGLALSPHNMLYVIDNLPYKVPSYDGLILHSVDAQGIATVEIAGKTYLIKPGQAWTDSGDVKQEPPAGCHSAYLSRVSNLGLLSKAQIQFVDSLPWSPY